MKPHELWSPVFVKKVMTDWSGAQVAHHNNMFQIWTLRKAGDHHAKDWMECASRSCSLVREDCLNFMAEARMEQMSHIRKLSIILCGARS